MAYFPEYYGGQLWGEAIAGVGKDISSAMQYYREAHSKADEMDAMFQSLSKMENPITKKPFLEKGAYERLSVLPLMQRARAEGGMLSALQLSQSLGRESMDARYKEAATKHMNRLAEVSPLAGQVIRDANGEVIGEYGEKGEPHYRPKHAVASTPEKQAEEEIATHPSEQAAKEARAMRAGTLQPGQGTILEQPQYPAPGSWQEKTNEFLKKTLGDNWWSRNLGFTPEHEIRRAVRPPATVEPGQPQPPGGVGQPAGQQMRTDPRVKRIKDMYQSGQFGQVGSQQALKMAHQMIKALGYPDDEM